MILPFVCKCELVFDGQKLKTIGFIDTGNNLIYNGEESISIADSRLVNELMERGFFERLPCGCVTVNTLSGTSLVKVYQIDSLKIYFNNKINIYNKVKKLFNEKVGHTGTLDPIATGVLVV